jgi:hypothetical protein
MPPSKDTPIVDVRFDGPYRRLPNSFGDEWAPTWAADGALYTASDDGHGFGGITGRPIAFSRIDGEVAEELTGHTVNGLDEYQNLGSQGPESAMWKATPARRIGEHDFTIHAVDGGTFEIRRSDPDGTTVSHVSLPQIGTYPTFVTFQKGHRRLSEVLLGESFSSFVYLAFFTDIDNGHPRYIVARASEQELLAGEVSEWTYGGDYLQSWHAEPESAVAVYNHSHLGADYANWKGMNSYAVDGVIYTSIARCLYPWYNEDPRLRHIFRDSSIIASHDGGLTWGRPESENMAAPMFPGQRFGAPYFIWYGQDGAGSQDGASEYVYAISNDGFFEAGDDYVLGRVSRTRIADLDGSDWEFWCGTPETPAWTSKLTDAVPVLSNPGRSNMTGATFIEALGRYVMVSWHFTQGSWQTVLGSGDFSTQIEVFEAPHPWGPWTNIVQLTCEDPSWYVPVVAQKFQKSVSSSEVSAQLVVTGFSSTENLYACSFVPITLSTAPLEHPRPGYVGGAEHTSPPASDASTNALSAALTTLGGS